MIFTTCDVFFIQFFFRFQEVKPRPRFDDDGVRHSSCESLNSAGSSLSRGKLGRRSPFPGSGRGIASAYRFAIKHLFGKEYEGKRGKMVPQIFLFCSVYHFRLSRECVIADVCVSYVFEICLAFGVGGS